MGLHITKNAEIVLNKRYLRKNERGQIIETPAQMFDRVAASVAIADRIFDPTADIEKTKEIFLKLFTNLWFLPNSPTLMNAGRRLGQLAACFVLPIEDSMGSIFETLKHTAMIHKSGGGTGFSFSRIRPASDVVLSTAGVSSGPISFMSVFDVATETVKQGGTRRGANMGILRVDHPDIEAFIHAKSDLRKLNNFNLSVGLTDQFMDACLKGAEYDLVNPRTGKAVSSVSAEKIFNEIVSMTWQTGEPGVLFLDAINRVNPTPLLGNIEATNPCGEQPLLPYESCTLGSINLSKMVVKSKIDYKRLEHTVRQAVHFLDNVIEINRYPLLEIEHMSKQTRKIGLGVMGFADILIKLGIAYDSEAAVNLAETVMGCVQTAARNASAALAVQRGNFPAYKDSMHDRPETPHVRNATTTTIAPTGTISIIAGASSGVEPLFAVALHRRVLDGKDLYEVHPQFIKMARELSFYDKKLTEEIAESGSIQSMPSVPDTVKRLFRTSHDISPEWHIRIQAAFQKYTDNAVSKTVNLPADASETDVKEIYQAAHRYQCKGVTIYRYGSRKNQVLQSGTDAKDVARIAPRPRPERTRGITERIQTGCGKLYVTINSDEDGMCEVFAQMGKTGGCASSQIEAAGRLISLALRSGVKVDAVIKQLIGIRCPSPSWQNGKMVLSCPDAISQVLKNVTNSDFVENTLPMGGCPECGGTISHEEGCLICYSCGYTKCG
jgi:ribonucleoside-diphosphate reductase alpha chain